MSQSTGSGSSDGWVDLAATFAEAVLVVPPVPPRLRQGLLRVGEWCWSTRADIDPLAMYVFERYVTEAIDEPVGDYAAVSHAGHGSNSYGLNFDLVHEGVGVFVQHGWGGVYMNPVETRTDIAYSYAVLDQLLKRIKPAPTSARLNHILCYSDFRGACSFRRRPDNAAGARDEGLATAPWEAREFADEQSLLVFAADTLIPDHAVELTTTIYRAASDA